MVRALKFVYWRTPGDISLLLYQLSKAFLISLGLSTLLHLLLLAFGPNIFHTPNGNLPQPDYVKFFPRRDPQLTKPIELRKVPLPKRQFTHREVNLAPARIVKAPELGTFSAQHHINRLSLPTLTPNFSSIGTEDIRGTLKTMVPIRESPVGITRHDAHQIDMALEMLDVNSLDTGRYMAMVIQDPQDPQAIKGFVKLAYALSRSELGWPGVSQRVQEIDALADALNEYTGLRAEMVGHLTLDDSRILEVPLLPLPLGRPRENEMENLVRYLLEGGFIMGGVSLMEKEIFEGLEKYGGLERGKDFWSESLPEDHPIYSSFFKIQGGIGRRTMSKNSETGVSVIEVDGLVGYFIKGRMFGIEPIESWRWLAHKYQQSATRELMLAVNIVIYALTQEGSLTQRLMRLE